MTIYNRYQLKTRAPGPCAFCSGRIEIGAAIDVREYVGEPESERMHLLCRSIHPRRGKVQSHTFWDWCISTAPTELLAKVDRFGKCPQFEDEIAELTQGYILTRCTLSDLIELEDRRAGE